MKFVTMTALAALLAAPAVAQGWKEDYQIIRFGILSGENEQDRIMRYTPLEEYLERELGVEVEIFSASSYDGVVQAQAADQIEFAFHGSSSYAALYTETGGGVVPLFTSQNADGSTGYYSIIVTRCDSGIKSLADLQGKVLAFADPDSTSGYAVPYYNLVEREGITPETYFAAVPFSGSHEAGVQAVANGTFDAAATYQDSDTNGIPQRMVSKGMLEEGTICKIWESPEITSGPFTARANLPAEMIEDVKQAMLAFPVKEPEQFAIMRNTQPDEENPTVGYSEVNHERYQWIIDMRQWLREQRRS
ncbi:phosphonate ABC transporter substrate-binding protein [Halovulum dunhuangense]|uniref:Phosphonate ABC transporter substrate-binding protein n=1 Tax=Halovulum dunhuangense TaxID=1505036 RepID=A0A849L258_9RHOB|nr:phosphonate ABC transporter substrate-binding protein [Halovulum dunhuangense]NNU80349.1 phosphonate ABC transporter substrate-binding protein [Halovulum dunhuangense]